MDVWRDDDSILAHFKVLRIDEVYVLLVIVAMLRPVLYGEYQ